MKYFIRYFVFIFIFASQVFADDKLTVTTVKDLPFLAVLPRENFAGQEVRQLVVAIRAQKICAYHNYPKVEKIELEFLEEAREVASLEAGLDNKPFLGTTFASPLLICDSVDPLYYGGFRRCRYQTERSYNFGIFKKIECAK